MWSMPDDYEFILEALGVAFETLDNPIISRAWRETDMPIDIVCEPREQHVTREELEDHIYEDTYVAWPSADALQRQLSAIVHDVDRRYPVASSPKTVWVQALALEIYSAGTNWAFWACASLGLNAGGRIDYGLNCPEHYDWMGFWLSGGALPRLNEVRWPSLMRKALAVGIAMHLWEVLERHSNDRYGLGKEFPEMPEDEEV
jgi:hypothetical protein